ncbi:unnamed protein product, partial [Brassica napus]
GGCVFVGSTPVMCVLSFLDTGSIVYGSKGGGKGSASPRPNGASSSARSRSVEEAIPTVLVGGAWQSWAFSSGLRESSNGLVEHMLRSMVLGSRVDDIAASTRFYIFKTSFPSFWSI